MVDLQDAYGVGGGWDLPVPGLAIAGDIRHVTERFASQPDFASWGARVHQSYSHSWAVGTSTDKRTFIFAESVELIPLFESSDAFQSRTLVQFILPVIAKPLVNMNIPIVFGSDYMRNASPGFKPHYWKTTIGVEFTFGPE
jgi:hypothetical protein